MFMQVIEGRVENPQRLAELSDAWIAELAPGALGWLSSTVGATADGTGILVARFESAEAARRNSDRPEQGAWWSEAEKVFSGPVSFSDYDGVTVVRDGAPDGAQFVQVMLGRTDQPDRMRELAQRFNSRVPASFRPDILGGVVGVNDDGQFAQAFYFSTEEEARRGEQQAPPEELRAEFEEEMSLASSMRYLDLTNPTHRSAT